MTNRRNFIKQMTALGITSGFPEILDANTNSLVGLKIFTPSFASTKQVNNQNKIWANLLHLSYNMWEDTVPLKYRDENYNCTTCQDARMWAHPYRPFLTFDDPTWNQLLNEMATVGMNMVLIDVGDGVQYESHPEIAVENAWTKEKLSSELVKMRKLGLEPIPKLNFAATHDIWMGEYSRMVSTKLYYEVCRDLISEVIELFDTPRFFHLGMDEETALHQKWFNYAVIRQNDLWWGDLYFYIGEVEKKGVRSWIWSDYAWHHPHIFLKKMPKSVLQSNWYYGTNFNLNSIKEQTKTKELYSEDHAYELYNVLEEKGYDQVPTGSNHSNNTNMEMTVEYCKKIINPSRLYGFMTAPWRPTLAPCLDKHKEAIDQMGRAINKF